MTLLPPQHLGDTCASVEELCKGSHSFSSRLQEAKRPMIIVGHAALSQPSGAALMANLGKLAQQVA